MGRKKSPVLDNQDVYKRQPLADLFEEAAAICGQPKKVSNWIMGETLRLLKEKGEEPEDIRFSPGHLAALIAMVDRKEINGKIAKDIFEVMYDRDVDPEAYAEEKGDVYKRQAVVDALHKAVDEMADVSTFHGYAPDLGYEFLRNAIVENDFRARGCDIRADEIFVSDGAKSDSANIQEIFGLDNKIAVCDPVYPVYVDSNVMAGRTGSYDAVSETWSEVIYMPCTAENGFVPELPEKTPDMIYLCFPNNPTGCTITKDQLQVWVDYANKVGAVIIFDAAYEAYIAPVSYTHLTWEVYLLSSE